MMDFWPGAATEGSVIIGPGAAFRMLSWDSDGTMAAEWLRQHGAAALVLKPRVTKTETDGEHTHSQARAAAAWGSNAEPGDAGAEPACCETAQRRKAPDDAPPTSFMHADNDPVSASSPSHSLASKAAGSAAELASYSAGGHGFGMPDSR